MPARLGRERARAAAVASRERAVEAGGHGAGGAPRARSSTIAAIVARASSTMVLSSTGGGYAPH